MTHSSPTEAQLSGDASAPSPGIPLAAGWHLWHSIMLRGAGFPVRLLEPLAAPDTVAALGVVRALEDKRAETLRAAVSICEQPREGDNSAWRKSLRALRKGRLPDSPPPHPKLASLLGDLAGLDQDLSKARNALRTAFDGDINLISRYLSGIAGEPRFREALIWQNPELLRSSINALANAEPRPDNRIYRRRLIAAVSYLQRYCAKNDSIGFFGPVGWSRWNTGIPGVAAEVGPQLIRARFFRFEYWAMDRLSVELLRRVPELKKWLPPRRNPLLGLNGREVLLTDNQLTTLHPRVARLVALCDGKTPACDVARQVTGNTAESFPTERDALDAIGQLAKERLLLWDAAVATSDRGDEELRDLLSRVRDEETRTAAMAIFSQLLDAYRDVASAVGNPNSLERAMSDLESCFTAITGSAPTRHAGDTYAGRTLVYHDCVRDLDLQLGLGPLRALDLPLSLVLQSADWYVNAAWEEFARRFTDFVLREQQETGRSVIRLDRLLHSPAVLRTAAAIVASVATELQCRWMQLTKAGSGSRRRQCEASVLAADVSELFRVNEPRTYHGRYYSPDLMIAAGSTEHIRRGSYLWVLGEVHAGTNTQLLPVATALHPNPREMFARVAREQRRPRVWMSKSRHAKGGRVGLGLRPADDLLILYDDTPAKSDTHHVAIGDLVVERIGATTSVRTLDGSKRFQIEDFFRGPLQTLCATSFSLFPKLPHLPRVTVDKLVIQREQWRFPCRDLAFSTGPDLADRFTLALRWLQAQELPRRVFARFAFEKKPVFVDFHSPISVEILVKLINKAVTRGADETVTLTEMLPEPDQCWLPDAGGDRYTSELRVVAVDPESRLRVAPGRTDGGFHTAPLSGDTIPSCTSSP